MTSVVFVPLDRAEALTLRAGADLGVRPGCAPTAALAAHLGPNAVPEEVEFAALSQAGVLALSTGTEPLRLVLAADVTDAQVSERGSELGQISVSGLRWSQVQAVFADEPTAELAVASARAEAAGLDLAGALATEAVITLESEFDLLWFGPEELDRLVGDQR